MRALAVLLAPHPRHRLVLPYQWAPKTAFVTYRTSTTRPTPTALVGRPADPASQNITGSSNTPAPSTRPHNGDDTTGTLFSSPHDNGKHDSSRASMPIGTSATSAHLDRHHERPRQHLFEPSSVYSCRTTEPLAMIVEASVSRRATSALHRAASTSTCDAPSRTEVQ
ncbi:non-reducing end alpha-L-arabinofuranosidase family hydrolase [Streptosporangium longisporum]|uniref:non-reducing end alpha-L-arabinofuranosidase family hydrolase n=1 Tax=Streptosporangium longisporum TaxID=46187 RepID=UPI003CD07185